MIEAARQLRSGKILAVKGLGGFHLACRADLPDTVAEMRRRKNREAKPLAVMVATLEEADRIVHLDDLTRAALVSLAHPIVLAPKRVDNAIAVEVAPGTHNLGVMMPYTPLHELLLAENPGPLVMTSGNPSSEPLCTDNAEAIERLGGIADCFLLHDRDIERRVDDSVVMG
ncbi:MAG: carbamoyltransferase HypF, partial [Phycisphaeraceae bacterium]|nr:carbamoyltransferase HypF [Phycisphaeraceae bacterium]